MTQGQGWERVEEIFHQALARPTDAVTHGSR